MPLKSLVTLATLALPIQAQVVLKSWPDTGIAPHSAFVMNLDGTALVHQEGKVRRVPISESDIRMPQPPDQGTFSLPEAVQKHGHLLRFLGKDAYFPADNQHIYRLRLGSSRPERWMDRPRESTDWLPLEEERLLLIGPSAPKEGEGEDKDLTSFLEVWTPNGKKPVKRIPFPDSFVRLHRAGMVLLTQCLVRNLGHFVFILHLQTGLSFSLDTRSLTLKEVSVPWHVISPEDVTTMKTMLKGGKGTLYRFNSDGAHTNLALAPLDANTVRMWSRWTPISDAEKAALTVNINGKVEALPALWSPFAAMDLDASRRAHGIRVYDLALEAESLRIQEVGHIPKDDPRLSTSLRPGAIPNPDGSWTSLDLWLKRRLPEPPKAPPPGATSKK